MKNTSISALGLGKFALVMLLTLLPPLATAEIEYTEQRSPCSNHDPLMQPFFGDFHVHTRYSLDANTQGTRTTPEQAYEFAKGAKLEVQPWTESNRGLRSLQLSRPLDFAMVSDHAELIGEVNMCTTEGMEGYNSWQCLLFRNWSRAAFYLFNFMATIQQTHMGQCGDDAQLCLEASLAPWLETQKAAEKHYDRSTECNFTTFVGYEWTGMERNSGGNLHRNVVFRNADVPDLPASFIDGPAAQSLWNSLDATCNQKEGSTGGCDSLIIPHNSNISSGHMFNMKRDDGSEMTAEYAQQRARFEPLVEIMQHKGASECYFESGVTTDELCNFEQQPINNIAGLNNPPDPNTGFVRRALGQGMQLQQKLGVNPYEFGAIASTDTHLGAPGAVEENQFLGHGGAGVPAKDKVPPGLPDDLKYNPGGLAVIWAQENGRDALFGSMRRRETYGTSGPRIISRFFAGWDYSDDLCFHKDRIAQAYDGGVPMGGNLEAAAMGAKLKFLVAASQDPGTKDHPGMPLQRLQIIKSWVTEAGELQEKVIDVAGDQFSDASVDLDTCEPRGKGFAELCAVWTDKDFQRDQQAYYYSRVVENPSCRWSQRICLAKQVDCGVPETIGEGLEGCCAPEHQPEIQERAWSSPIWYTPASLVPASARSEQRS
ncbi:MAG: hypothetical protein ACI9JM_001933 [Halioglobus sp.]|jgi:hypothetical protein